MDDKLEKKIIQGLEALESGQSLEQVLSQFPEDAEAIRPALEVAVMLADVRVAHSIQAQSKSRRRFLERAEALQQGPKEESDTALLGLWRRFFAPLAALAAIILVLSAGIFMASQSALPGDVLYGAKRTFEGIRLSLVRDLQVQEQLQQEFQEERLREIRELIENGRQAEVILEGEIESFFDNGCVVAGIPVEYTDSTIIDGDPVVGAEVQIRGRTTFDKVIADVVTVAAVQLPAPEPSATPTESILPQENNNLEATPDYEMEPAGPDVDQATDTPTPSRTATSTATATATETATPTATPTRTVTPSPQPSSTPTPDQTNENENENENTNDNDNTNENENENTNENVNENENENTNENVNENENTNENVNENENTNENDNESTNENDNESTNENDNENDNENEIENGNDNNSGPGGGGVAVGTLMVLALPVGLSRPRFKKR